MKKKQKPKTHKWHPYKPKEGVKSRKPINYLRLAKEELKEAIKNVYSTLP